MGGNSTPFFSGTSCDMTIRIGAVSYLNTKPLVYRLDELAPDAEIVYDFPSRLAVDLATGELDVALIPSIEFFQDPKYTIVSDACIGCRGPVLSVKFFSRVPVEKIRRVSLDEGSRTSIALVRVLLQQRYGIEPELESLPIGATAQDSDADAVLLIGDRAIHQPVADFVEIWDLGDEWCRWSELPFVFAMWVAHVGKDLRGTELALDAARDAGIRCLDEIAKREAVEAGLSPAQCLTYLRDNLHFHLGPRELRGLALFYEHAAALGITPPGRDLSFAASRIQV